MYAKFFHTREGPKLTMLRESYLLEIMCTYFYAN